MKGRESVSGAPKQMILKGLIASLKTVCCWKYQLLEESLSSTISKLDRAV